MKKLIMVVLLAAFFLQGCVETPVKQGCIRRPDLGVWTKILPSGQIEITKVVKDSVAEKAGVRKGDIIKAWDGQPLNAKKTIDYFDLIYKKEPKDYVSLTIQRNNEEVELKVKVGSIDVPKEIDVIMRILAEWKKVNLVVLIGGIRNVLIKDASTLAEWKGIVRNELLLYHEEGYLIWFGMWSNFTLVDRQRVEEILKELKFGLSGIVSTEVQNKLGEILGATHIVVVGYSRSPDKNMKTIRLIEIETGQVLASYTLYSQRI